MAFDKSKLAKMEQKTEETIAKANNVAKELTPMEFFDEELKTQCDLAQSSIESEDFENWLQKECEEMLGAGERAYVGVKLKVEEDKANDSITLRFSVCTPKEVKFKEFEIKLALDDLEDFDEGELAQIIIKAFLVIPGTIIKAFNDKFDALGIKHEDAIDMSDADGKEKGEAKMMIRLRFDDDEEE